jgi:hypothetical protein
MTLASTNFSFFNEKFPPSINFQKLKANELLSFIRSLVTTLGKIAAKLYNTQSSR